MHSLVRLLSSFVLLLCRIEVLRSQPHDPPTAAVRNGTLRGLYNAEYNQDFFLGIPYALPPLHELRFRSPQSLNSTWEYPKDATEYSTKCVGYGGDEIGYRSSEDCLTLNIIRPAGVNANAELPVVVWIHGGGFFEGGSSDKRYNVSFIVQNSVAMQQPMVAVSINYRLAGWGFLYGSTIASAGPSNFGLLDQRLALHWIQENIAAFGGSPAKVTIWGESAGAMSVGAHLLAYGGRDDGLFRAAIAESGTLYFFTKSNAVLAQEGYDLVMQKTGCATAIDQLRCLRRLPFSILNNAFSNTSKYFPPVIDGEFLTTLPSEQLSTGSFVQVPFLVGANSDEGTGFGQHGINSDSDFKAFVMSRGPDSDTADILSYLYPNIPAIGVPATLVNPPTSTALGLQYKRQAAFAGDYLMIAPRRASCDVWSNHNISVYCYTFNVLTAGMAAERGSTHFQEVAFVFDNIHGYGYTGDGTNPFADQPPTYIQLARIMSRMWVSFIVSLDPNKHGMEGVPAWPAYDMNASLGAKTMLFDTNITTLAYPERDVLRSEAIAFINSIAASQFGR